jgi:spore germination cell wall hydrolase CwlJ-like protein
MKKLLLLTIFSLIPMCACSQKIYNDEQIIALTLMMEARGEGIQGMMLVGQVIKNRSIERKLSLRTVCLQPKQFSCWNDINYSKINKLFDHKYYEVATGIARELLLNYNSLNVTYNHYHTIQIKTPMWARDKKGYIYNNHIFYDL